MRDIDVVASLSVSMQCHCLAESKQASHEHTSPTIYARLYIGLVWNYRVLLQNKLGPFLWHHYTLYIVGDEDNSLKDNVCKTLYWQLLIAVDAVTML